MPVQSTIPGLNVTRPELYFGELTDTDVYVKTRQQEFDYPQGQSNNLTSYQGTGGIAVGGFLRRLLLAADRGDLGTLPFSDDVNSESRLLMRRNIRDRVAHLAPFLTFDQDPYVVVGDDGRLSWIMDGFTTSNTYPYSTHYTLGDNPVNYMRNSVKVVIDAYNGTTTFYVFDQQDPVLQAWRRIFPALFQDAAAMPADLHRHVRYPEALFDLQSEVYGLYHMTNPEVFFNREDLWTVATETTTDANGNQIAAPMRPNFVLMKLPGGSAEEFVEILPFTPANRNNLIGWIAGRSDGENYGTAVVYDFPKTRLIDGPQQIEARIDQNAAALRPAHPLEPAGLARRPRQPARHPLGQGPPLRRTHLPAGPARAPCPSSASSSSRCRTSSPTAPPSRPRCVPSSAARHPPSTPHRPPRPSRRKPLPIPAPHQPPLT